MATKIAAARSALAWELARCQHGVLARRDLLALGFSPSAIRHRIATGRLHRVRNGVYAVGRSELTREGSWMATVLACGSDAVLSHGSAAALWGIGPAWRLIEVSVCRRSWPRLDGVKVRSRPSLPDHDITIHRGIPVTTPPRTILDQAATPISDASLERLVNEADAARGIELDAPSLYRYCDPSRRAGGQAPAEAARPGNLSPLRLRDRAPLSPARSRGRPPAAAHQSLRQRLRGRLLLVRPLPGRRGRLPSLPPQRHQAVPRSAARPGSHRLGPHHLALHPLAGRPRPPARRSGARVHLGA